jgi:hypothetical protein
MVGERPANDLAREGVEDHRQPDVGDVGRPDLVEAGGDEAAREIGHDRELMPGVRCVRDERLASQAKQIVLAHQPVLMLVVDCCDSGKFLQAKLEFGPK